MSPHSFGLRAALTALACVAAALLVSSCGGGGGASGVLPHAPGHSGSVEDHIVITSDASIILANTGATYQFAAQIENPSGAAVSGSLSWSSSDPSVASVSQSGLVTAQTSLGSATITISSPGLQAQTATVIVAPPSTGTILVPSSDLVSLSGSQVILTKDTTTSGIAVGDIIVSGSKAGLLGEVTSVSSSSSQVTVQLAQASLAQAFSQLSINVASAPEQMSVSIAHGQVQVADQQGHVIRTMSASELSCTDDGTGASVALNITGPGVTLNVAGQVQFQLQTSFFAVKYLSLVSTVTFTGTLTTGSLELAGATNLAFTCTEDLGNITIVPVPIGPILVGPSVDPQFGIQGNLNASGAITITGPSLTRSDTVQVGFSYNDGSLQLIASDTPTAQPTMAPFTTAASATITGSIGPFAAAKVGLTASLLGVQFLNIDFADIEADANLDASVALLPSFGSIGYLGPSWNLDLGLQASLDAEISAGDLQPLLNDIGLGEINLSLPPYTLATITLAQNPIPTVAVSPSTLTGGDASLTSQVGCGTVPFCFIQGSHVDFWAFKQGSSSGTKIGSADVNSDGQASTTWAPTSASNGQYEILAYLYDQVFGAAGLPYPSATSAPITVIVSTTSTPSPTPSPTSSPSPSPSPSPSSSPSPSPSPSSSPTPTGETQSPTTQHIGSTIAGYNLINAYSWPSLAQVPGTTISWTYVYSVGGGTTQTATGSCNTTVESFNFGYSILELDALLPYPPGGGYSNPPIQSIYTSGTANSVAWCYVVLPQAEYDTTQGTLTFTAVASGFLSGNAAYSITVTETGSYEGASPVEIVTVPMLPN